LHTEETGKNFDASKRERVRNSEAWKKTQLTKDEIEKVLIQAKEKEIKIEKAWKQAKLQKEETKKSFDGSNSKRD